MVRRIDGRLLPSPGHRIIFRKSRNLRTYRSDPYGIKNEEPHLPRFSPVVFHQGAAKNAAVPKKKGGSPTALEVSNNRSIHIHKVGPCTPVIHDVIGASINGRKSIGNQKWSYFSPYLGPGVLGPPCRDICGCFEEFLLAKWLFFAWSQVLLVCQVIFAGVFPSFECIWVCTRWPMCCDMLWWSWMRSQSLTHMVRSSRRPRWWWKRRRWTVQVELPNRHLLRSRACLSTPSTPPFGLKLCHQSGREGFLAENT